MRNRRGWRSARAAASCTAVSARVCAAARDAHELERLETQRGAEERAEHATAIVASRGRDLRTKRNEPR
jgi:hypothetical protein